MRDRQFHPIDKAKSPASQLTGKSPTPERDARETLAPQPDPLLTRLRNPASASAQAAMLNRAPSLASRSLLQLQRQHGNRYVQRVLAISRQGEESGEVSPEVEAGIQRQHGGGQALERPVKSQMESAFGTDFSSVRVHANAEANKLNEALNARAFTTGQDIFFRQGEYSPNSSQGKELLAHELTHTVQQMEGRVKPTTQAEGVPINDDVGLEREADVMGKKALQRKQEEQGIPSESGVIDKTIGSPERPVRLQTLSTDTYQQKDNKVNFQTVQLQSVEAAALGVDITDKVLSSAGGGSDLEITVDEMSGMFQSRQSKSKHPSPTSRTERKAEQFEFLLESVAFREDLISVKVIMDYEVDEFGVGNISFALVEAHDAGAGWGGRFGFNLTPRDAGSVGEVTLTVSFDVSGWIGSASGSFSYSIAPYGKNIYLMRSIGDVNGWSSMNQKHFAARAVF